ncbi:MAG TPA: ECF transporter S component [Clostridiales bacterium]|nr:ECF transporter S component [Clostridiales bacterium]
MKQSTLKLTQLALFSALITAMTFIPYVGYITIGASLSITTLHIPVIIGAVLLGKVSGTVLGTVWGVTCLIYAALNGTADAVIFLNPMISVVPRIFVGLLTAVYYDIAIKLGKDKFSGIVLSGIMDAVVSIFVGLFVYRLSGNTLAGLIAGVVFFAAVMALILVFSKKLNQITVMPIAFAAILGTFTNTVLVLTAINIFNPTGFVQLTGIVGQIFSVVITLNGVVEMLAAIFVAVPCVSALQRAQKRL